MKSLQIVTPHLECVFHCPFCIAKAHEHENSFLDEYGLNYESWKGNLEKVLKHYLDLSNVVITGTNEPMQSQDCVKNIINIVRNTRKDVKIEIQTRWYKQELLYNEIDVVAYSIADYKLLDKIKPLGKISRYVIILTDSFAYLSLDRILEKIPKEVTQVTFKVLQNSLLRNTSIDSWIDKHRLDNESYLQLKNEVEQYQGNLSIRLDADCMNAENRYKVFREDGKLYSDWDSVEFETIDNEK